MWCGRCGFSTDWCSGCYGAMIAVHYSDGTVTYEVAGLPLAASVPKRLTPKQVTRIKRRVEVNRNTYRFACLKELPYYESAPTDAQKEIRERAQQAVRKRRQRASKA